MIKDKVKKLSRSEYLPMMFFSLGIWILMLRMGLREGSDDTVYLTQIEESGIFQWIYNRTLTWQPRIYSDIATAILIDKLFLWRVLTALMLTLIMICISKMVINNLEYREAFAVNYFICCVFFFISPYVITSAVMWFTGSFHYLWPVTAMIVALVPFYYAVVNKSTVYKNLNAIFGIAAICACYTEQTIAILVCFGTLSIGYLFLYRIKINKSLCIQYILILVNSSIYFLLSQISDRMSAELHWYVGFDMLSIIDKIFQGINWTNYHYINSSNLLMLVMSILLFTIIAKKNGSLVKVLGAVPMVFLIGNMIPFDALFQNINNNNTNAQFWSNNINPYQFNTYLNDYFYNTTKVNTGNLLDSSLGNMIPSFIGLFILLFISGLLWIAFDKKEDKFLTVILYLAALASGYAISFSPTIFASGSRIFFVGNILIIFVTAKLLCEFLKNKILYPKWSRYIFLGIALLIWFQLAVQFASGILWL